MIGRAEAKEDEIKTTREMVEAGAREFSRYDLLGD